MERECAPVCGVTCDMCPAHANFANAPTNCRVLNAVIGAYEAQEEFWKRADMEDLMYGIEHRLDSMRKELKNCIKEAERDIRGP